MGYAIGLGVDLDLALDLLSGVLDAPDNGMLAEFDIAL